MWASALPTRTSVPMELSTTADCGVISKYLGAGIHLLRKWNRRYCLRAASTSLPQKEMGSGGTSRRTARGLATLGSNTGGVDWALSRGPTNIVAPEPGHREPRCGPAASSRRREKLGHRSPPRLLGQPTCQNL